MTNPTLQASGALSSLLRLDWNASYVSQGAQAGMPVSFAGIEYGPPNAPGQSWTPGTEFQAIAAGTVNGFGTMVNLGSWSQQAGYAGLVNIMDMSPATVLPGKTYGISVALQWQWVQLYFLLVGSTAGTTVLPGFGLYNLDGNPHAWTYVTPLEFTGAWEMDVLSPESAAPVLLSVDYARPWTYDAGTPETAKLIFNVRGGTVTQGLSGFSPTLQSDLASPPARGPEGGGGPVGTQYLLGDTACVRRRANGEVLDGR